jgi:hypothetical protein
LTISSGPALSECRKVFENQKEPESGIRAGFAVLLACFFLNYKPQNTYANPGPFCFLKLRIT